MGIHYNYDEFDKDVVERIKSISEKIDKEKSSENADKEKLFRLRYAQMIQGLYLQNGQQQ